MPLYKKHCDRSIPKRIVRKGNLLRIPCCENAPIESRYCAVDAAGKRFGGCRAGKSSKRRSWLQLLRSRWIE